MLGRGPLRSRPASRVGTVDVGQRLVELWPLFGLRLRIADVELRLPSDAVLARLADVMAGGVHPPERKPFASAWTDAPPATRCRSGCCAMPGPPARSGAFVDNPASAAVSKRLGYVEDGTPCTRPGASRWWSSATS